LLNEMLGFAANRLIELETDVLCNTVRHERSGGRTNYRNGYRPRLARLALGQSNSR
jgi:hypothetical protein